jgi:proliferating cell nuclear antigen
MGAGKIIHVVIIIVQRSHLTAARCHFFATRLCGLLKMLACFHQGTQFKDIIGAIKPLLTDFLINFSPDGLKISAMDPSHVSMMIVELPAEGFASFECKRPIYIGTNVITLHTVLGMGTPNETLVLSCKESPDILTFQYTGGGSRERVFDIKLLEIESDSDYNVPEIKPSLAIDLPSGEFRRMMTDLGKLGDVVRIAADNDDWALFEVNGETLGRGKITIKQDAKTTIQCSKPISQLFAMRYLTHFSEASKLADQVEIAMGDVMPLMMTYTFAPASASSMVVDDQRPNMLRFFLAPKIEDQD